MSCLEANKGQVVGGATWDREQREVGVTLVPVHRQYGAMACQCEPEYIAVPFLVVTVSSSPIGVSTGWPFVRQP